MKTRLTLTWSLVLAVAAMPSFAAQVSAGQSRSSSPCDRAPVSEGRDRAAQRTAGDLQVCLVAVGVDAETAAQPPTRWVTDSQRFVIETRQGNTVQRLDWSDGQASWHVDGVRRTFDAAAQTWRDRALEALDAPSEIARLQSQIAAERRAMSRLQMSASRFYTPVDPANLQVTTAIERLDGVRKEAELSDHEFALARMERDIRVHEAAMTRLAAAIATLLMP